MVVTGVCPGLQNPVAFLNILTKLYQCRSGHIFNAKRGSSACNTGRSLLRRTIGAGSNSIFGGQLIFM